MTVGESLPEVSDADWARTPDSVKRLVGAMAARIVALEALQEQVAVLQHEVASLREQLRLNSNNSSKPPSSDGPAAPPPTAKPSSKRPKGAQKGHPRNTRTLLPPDKVDAVCELRPTHCAKCEQPLTGDDPAPRRHQVVEIPEVLCSVTEWQVHTLPCSVCQTHTAATLPDTVPSGSFGPRLLALVALMTGRYRVSKRSVEEMLAEVFGIELSLGTVCEAERKVSEAIAAPVAKALEHVRAQPVAHMDETSWCEAKTRAWLWVFATRLVTVFQIASHRSEAAARALLGTFAGVLSTDRYGAYSYYPLGRRQLCWAHLIRDFTRMAERDGESGWIGRELLALSHKVFLWWARLKSGQKTRAWFVRKVSPLRGQVATLLASGQTCGHAQTAGTCAEMEKVQSAFWTFVTVEGVEPTNNLAEQQIRHGVMWRKTSFGTDSEVGSRFVERILSVVKSLKAQGRNILGFLEKALVASWRKTESPSLLPVAA